VRHDQNGCRASSPIQVTHLVRPAEFDIEQIDAVEAISICQYIRGLPTEEPALTASRRITGIDAGVLLKGLQEAPAGRGPEAPSNCAEDFYGDTGVVLRLNGSSATRETYPHYDNCVGSGSDDGTTQRVLTRETCAPRFEAPVIAWGCSSAVTEVCGRY
jgi:hypothetical protein